MVPQTIAIIGTEHHVGSTHIALALANYLRNKLGKHTAYIELNPSRQIHHLSSQKSGEFFRFLRIDIYPEVTPNKLLEIYDKKYEYFVLDMGVPGPNLYPEFLRCKYRFVIGNVSKWNQHIFGDWLEKQQKYKIIHLEEVSLLGNLGIKDDLNAFYHQYHLPIQEVPFLANPFQLTPSDWIFFEKILKRN